MSSFSEDRLETDIKPISDFTRELKEMLQTGMKNPEPKKENAEIFKL